jgi:hypothetical protein
VWGLAGINLRFPNGQSGLIFHEYFGMQRLGIVLL